VVDYTVNIYMDTHGEQSRAENIQRMVEVADHDALLVESDLDPDEFEYVVEAAREYTTLGDLVDAGYLDENELNRRGFTDQRETSSLARDEVLELWPAWTYDRIANLNTEISSGNLCTPEKPVFGDKETDKAVISLTEPLRNPNGGSIINKVCYATSINETEIHTIDNNREEAIAQAMRSTDHLPNNPRYFHILSSMYEKDDSRISEQNKKLLKKLKNTYKPEKGFREALNHSSHLRDKTMSEEIEEILETEEITDIGVLVGNNHAKKIPNHISPKYKTTLYDLPEQVENWQVVENPKELDSQTRPKDIF
jgi:hypothetical protein